MAIIPRVTMVRCAILDVLPAPLLTVAALGEVNTTGWSGFRLSPRYYLVPPADGLWDFTFNADAPVGAVGQVVLPVGAMVVEVAPPWLKGVRVNAASNSMVDQIGGSASPAMLAAQAASVAPVMAPVTFGASGARVIVRQSLAAFDDSFQPTGTIHWHNDGPFGTPTPHVEMKKLHHELTLVVEGPDEARIRSCINQAIAAGLIAAIAAAFATGGLALQAAISAALTALTACLGNNFSADGPTIRTGCIGIPDYFDKARRRACGLRA